MATALEELRVRAENATTEYTTALSSFSDDNLPTPDQEAHVTALRGAMLDARQELNRQTTFAANRAEFDQQQQELRGRRGSGNLAAVNRPLNPDAEGLSAASIGSQFFENPSYREWLSHQVNASGFIPDGDTRSRLTDGPKMHFKGLRAVDYNDGRYASELVTGGSDTSAGVFVQTQRYPGLTELGRRPLVIRQSISQATTESDTIEYVRVTAEYNRAAPVAEATGTSGSSGVKPESGLEFEKITTYVRTLAHWIPATRRALSDAGQMRAIIDDFLRSGLDEKLEDEIVQGDGTGEHFTGILNATGVQAQAWDTDIFKTTRIARRKVRTVGRRTPNAYWLNPIDWETIDLQKDLEGRYYFGGPASMGNRTLWGLPVIESEAVPVGTGLVGDFSTCVLWDREDINLSVSDSHMDFFTRNLVAILAECRAAFGILKPNALVEIDLTA